jgi:hypothetical protein
VPGRTLHPNLARIAVAYDMVISRLGRGEMSDARALQEIQALVTRDDQGVQWSINARTGRWQRKELTGVWVEAVPPEFGLRTATPLDFAPDGSLGFDPESQVRLVEVDLARINSSASSLTGATLRPQLPAARKRWGRWVLGAALIAVLAAVALTWWPGSGPAGVPGPAARPSSSSAAPVSPSGHPAAAHPRHR